MKARELILLSPYRYPAGHAMSLGDDDMAVWMNAWTALWHPAALWGAAGPPRVDSPYDHENPQGHFVYGVPESPPLMLSEDWPERVKQAGAVILPGTKDRPVMLEKTGEALATMTPGPMPQFTRSTPYSSTAEPTTTTTEAKEGDEAAADPTPELPATTPDIHAKLLALKPEQIQPFFAVGLGYLLLSALAEAMEHENLLEREEFWLDIQRALAELAGVPYPQPASDEGMPPEDEPTLFPDDPGDEVLANTDSNVPNLDATPPGSAGVPPANATASETAGETPALQPTASGPDTIPEVAEMERREGYNGYGSAGRSYYEQRQLMEPWYAHLHTAAQRLQTAREVLYPVTIYLLDLVLLDEQILGQSWPASFSRGIPVNVIASSALLEKLGQSHPDRLEALKHKLPKGEAEVCGGCYLEREDNLLPIESQLWNLLTGQAVARGLLDRPIEVFARQRFYAHPQLPLFLSTCGLNRALLIPFDDSAGPQFRSTLVSWPSPDGKQLDVFVRTPLAADAFETFFNLGHHLHKTIREDHSATLAFLHRHKSAVPWYEDFLELGRFGPVFGEWRTFSQYFGQAMTGEYTGTHTADEFHYDYLSSRTGYGTAEGKGPTDFPVSGFARHARLRRHLETCWTLAAMQRGLAGKNDPLRVDETLNDIEDRLEREGPSFISHPHQPEAQAKGLSEPEALAKQGCATNPEEITSALDRAEKQIVQALTDRLLARATGTEPGCLILNPCSFRRRVSLEIDGVAIALPIGDAVKACQLDGGKMLVVAEVPALGFAWIPKAGPPGTPPPPLRIRLADDTHVRNEFLEAEIDPQTGGLRSVADRRSMVNRLTQRLVFNPGSTMQATGVTVVSAGPALGEVVTEGVLLGLQKQVLAKFRQRLRVWLGRPVLELRIEITPEQPAAGYPWHAYYGCRFGWGEDRATLLRGVHGTSHVTTHLRPQTPDFFEIRGHRHNTVIFPGGLPFLRRHGSDVPSAAGGRMVDVVLVPQAETSQTFDLAIALDRDYPMQTALELITPVPHVFTATGPPHVGASGWLYHLDTLNLLLTSMRPGGSEGERRGVSPPVEGESAATDSPNQGRDLIDAITVRLLECGSQSGQAEFHCVRNPTRAAVLNAHGDLLLESTLNGDAAMIEVTPNDFNQLQIEFGERE